MVWPWLQVRVMLEQARLWRLSSIGTALTRARLREAGIMLMALCPQIARYQAYSRGAAAGEPHSGSCGILLIRVSSAAAEE